MSSAAVTVNSPIQSSTYQPKQQQRQTAKDVIAENVKALIAQLEAGKSDALTAYLDAMARFHNYSFGNILAITRQKPTATNVAGMFTWNQLGRRVKKGEKGIQILAPMIGTRRKSQEEAEQDGTGKSAPVLVGFRAVYVFADRGSRASRTCHSHRRSGSMSLKSNQTTLRICCFMLHMNASERTGAKYKVLVPNLPPAPHRCASVAPRKQVPII
jgi:hypothetical protein